MKKVIVIGAMGSLAQEVIQSLLPLNDVALTLFVRSKRRLPAHLHTSCRVIEGDAMIYADVRNAVQGHDIVYENLSGNLEAMTNNIIHAMQEMGVKRLLAISSIGIYDEPVRTILKPYRKLADLIEASGLDYTILRPDWFTDLNEVDFVISRKGEPETGTAVSRKSIASFITDIVRNPGLYSQENVGISKPN